MLNPKKSIFPAVFGFVLSFFISIIATHRLWRSLLRGLIFAVVFAVLFIAIDYIFDRFLDKEDGTVGLKKSDTKHNGKIDITISDEDLTDDGEDLRFPVTMNKMGLSQEDTQVLRTKPEPSASTAASSGASSSISPAPSVSEEVSSMPDVEDYDEDKFTPSPLASSDAKVEKAPAESVIDTSNVGLDSNGSTEIDELPDIADFDAELGDDGDSFVDDSDFASNGSTSLYTERSAFSDGSRASDHDAATIAKAIQTALKREE